jgi:2-amino-4-hydroxy-6-hydroxymethyldihydropteridine diphosphokinase
MAGPETPPDGVTVANVGMGANLGDARATLAAAVEALADLGDVRAVSPLYETDPVGFEDQPVILNGAVAIATRLSPHELLDGLLAFEARLGRERTVRWGPRTLDLDLLAMDAVEVVDARLTVPHPRLVEREFALRPLGDIAPGLVVDGIAVADRLAALEPQGVRPAGPVP